MSYQEKLDQSSFGLQRPLIVTTFPAASTVKQADLPRLIDQAALADGTYYCRVDVSGVSALNLQMKATFAAGSVTVTAFTNYLLSKGTAGVGTASAHVSDAEASAAPFIYQTFSGTGALTTVTLQTATIAAMKGEQFAIVKIVVAGGAAPVFTQAEINGPR